MRATAMVMVVGCALACLATTAAAQQPSAQFTKEYQAGIDAYRVGNYEVAKGHLEAAKGLEPTLPGPWRYLGVVAQAEGRWPDCVASMREAIRLNPKSSEIVDTRKVHDECRAAWGKDAFNGTYAGGDGALAVNTDQVGAAVEINGLSAGSTPMAPTLRPIGEVEVKVTKKGYLPASRTVTILPNIVTDVDFTLEVDTTISNDLGLGTPEMTTGWVKVVTSVADALVEIDGKPGTLDAQGRYELEAGPHQLTVSADGREPYSKTVRVSKGQLVTVEAELRSQGSVDQTRKKGRIVLGAGLGMALVGAITGILGLGEYEEARDKTIIEQSRPSFSLLPRDESQAIAPIHTREHIDKVVARGDRLSLISNISYGVAVVAIGVGAYYLVKGRPRGEKAALTFIPLWDGEGGHGAAAMTEVRW